MHRLFAGISSTIVLIALIWGFVLVGSPIQSRQERLDERRLSDLQIMHWTIQDIIYEGRPWDMPADGTLRRPLPESLQAIADQATGQRVPLTDPLTEEPYGYEKTGPMTYELCATFTTSRDEPFDIFWNHGAGRTCFRFDARRADGLGGGELKPVMPRSIE